MGRLKRAAAILDAAEQWKQRCLLDGGSLFTDERLWTRENFEQLRIHFVEKLDEGTGAFDEKLQVQLTLLPPRRSACGPRRPGCCISPSSAAP